MSESPDETIERLLETARQAARAGARVLLERFTHPRQIGTKSSPTDLVTDADRASEAEILRCIEQRHPRARILAEESGVHGSADRGGAGTTWVVDPLDGTVNYAWGIPHWCISIAVLEGGAPVVGVVYDPIRQECFEAIRGGGARMNGEPMATGGRSEISDAILATGFSYDLDERRRHLPSLQRLLLRCRGLRRFGSAALDLAWVACGRLDGFWERALKPWDLAAGLLLVAEAGGRISGYEKDEDPLRSGRVVAAGPRLHGLLRRSVASADPP